MGHPVGARCFHGQQRAGHLVLALGTAFEAGKAVGDAPFDGLVVAGFEMQAVDPFQSAPVATIGRLVINSCLRLSILKKQRF